jgi:hypothetical protein
MTHNPTPIFAGPGSAPSYPPVAPQDTGARRAARVFEGYLAALARTGATKHRDGVSDRERVRIGDRDRTRSGRTR